MGGSVSLTPSSRYCVERAGGELGGTDILVGRRVRECGHSCPPNAREQMPEDSPGSGGKNATTPRPTTGKNACPTTKNATTLRAMPDKNVCPTNGCTSPFCSSKGRSEDHCTATPS